MPAWPERGRKEEVHFLIEPSGHVATRSASRPFDPATVSGFARQSEIKSAGDCKDCCLLTYAELCSNPEHDPGKAEMLWQLTSHLNNFSRKLDTDRLHAHDALSLLAQVRRVTTREHIEIERVLEGFSPA